MIAWMLLACNGKTMDSAAPAVGEGCHPAIAEVCAMPFPSTALMVEDAETASGWRVSIPAGVLPANNLGVPMDPAAHNRLDGFSTWGPLAAWLGPVDASTLTTARSDLAADRQIYVLDAETGARVPAWAEVDRFAEDPAEQTLTIRLAQPMAHARRHVVAIQGLTTPDGAPVPSPTGFAALQAGSGPADHQAHYDDNIFPVLEAAGLDPAAVQLAWDLVTVSEESSLGPARAIAAAAQDHAPSATVTEVTDHDCSDEGVYIGRTVEGTFTAPLYLDEESRRLIFDDAGQPVLRGEAEVEFLARIPCTLLEDPRPGWVVQFGHGFLGKPTEIEQDFFGPMQEEHGWILLAARWRGMSLSNRTEIIEIISQDLSRFSALPDQVIQGYAEFDRLLAAARTVLPSEEALMVDGTPLVDADQFGFYGISQGGILGAGYLGFSPSLERGALSVPGGPFTSLMPRSQLFGPFLLLFQEAYPDPQELAVVLASLQTLWDPGEGAGWVGTMTDDVLIQTGLGDSQVSTVGAQSLARALGATLVSPATRPVYGLTEGAAGFSGSAFVEWDFEDVLSEPELPVPADGDTDTHRCVRRQPAAQAQVQAFIETGIVEQACTGSCVAPTTDCVED